MNLFPSITVGQCNPSSPSAAFSVNSDTLCYGDTAVFSNSSTGYKVNYQWNFGDTSSSQNTSSQSAPQHIYTNGGTSTRIVTVQLIVTDSCGSRDTAVADLYIFPLPQADFTPGTNPVCDNQNVVMVNSSSGVDLTYAWDFGDPGSSSNTSSSVQPGHQFDISTADTFQVKLVVSHAACNTSDSVTQDIVVGPFPTAGFTFTDSLCTGNLAFTNTSTGSGLSYSWDFGDPNSGATNSSTASSPSHLYDTTGTGYTSYSVKLTATNQFGCIDSVRQTRYVRRGPDITIQGNLTQCGTNNTHQVVIFNQSSTSSTNNQYIIQWGDTITNIDTLSTLTFDTNVYTGTGAWKLKITIEDNAGCTRTDSFTVFNGTNPSGGLASPGNTTNLCAPDTIGFIPTNYSNNPDGSVYIFSVDDGSAPQRFVHPPPDTIYHIFTSSSCGATGNSYTATLRIENPCGFTSGTVTPITVNRSPNASMSVSRDTACLNKDIVYIEDISSAGSHVYFSGSSYTCNQNTLRYWTITPNTYQLVNGTLGTNLISGSDGTDELSIRFTDTGVYTVNLYTGFSIFSNPSFPCGTATTTRQIYIRDTVVAGFNLSLSPSNGCVNNVLSTSNLSTGPVESTLWTITPNTGFTYASGNQYSDTPSFQFTDPGQYTVTQKVFGICNDDDTFTTVTIRDVPEVNLPIDQEYCGSQTVVFSSTNTLHLPSIDTNFSSLTNFSWGISGGNFNFVSGTDSTSRYPSIQFQDTGTYQILFRASNACGFSDADTQFVRIKPIPVVDSLPDSSYCPGQTISIPAFTSDPTGATFSWTNSNTSIGLSASGTGNISNFTAPSNTGGSLISSNIAVTPTKEGCVGPPMTFTIQVKPDPEVDPITDITVCPGDTVNVPAFGSTPGGSSFAWTNSDTSNGLAGSGSGNISSYVAPQNLGTGFISGVVYYNATLNGCTGPSDSFEIAIRPKPILDAINDTVYCPNSSVSYPAFTSVPTGASFSWNNADSTIGLGSSDTGNIPNFQTFNNLSGSLVTTTVIVTPFVGVCVGTADTFEIGIRPAPQITVTNDTSVCPADTVFIPTFTASPSGSSFNWTNSNTAIGLGSSGSGQITSFASASNTSGSNRVGQIRVIPELNACPGAADTFEITVKPTPQLQNLSNSNFCPGDSVPAGSWTSSPTGASFIWTNSDTTIGLDSSGNGQTPAFVASTNSSGSSIIATIRIDLTLDQCPGDADSFTLTLKPTPFVVPNNDTAICPYDSIFLPAFTSTPSGADFSWYNNNTLIGIADSGTTAIGAWKGPENLSGSTRSGWIRIVPELNACVGPEDSLSLELYAQPNVNAGVEDTLCNGQQVQIGQSTLSGQSYAWTSLPAGYSDDSSYTVVNPNQSTDFILRVIDSTHFCRSFDTVNIHVDPVLSNNTINSDQTICSGQIPDTLIGSQASGGDGNYIYQWQLSTDSSTWTDISGATNRDHLSGALFQNSHFRRVVVSGPCSDTSGIIRITVLSGISNNTVSGSDSICQYFSADSLLGSMPTGGSGNYAYQWQISADTTANIQNITSATGRHYVPGTMDSTRYFRRLVASGACEVPSNWVRITVMPKPNAKISLTNNCFGFASQLSSVSSISSGTIDSLSWTLSDSNFSNQTAPSLTYDSAGLKSIGLYIVSDFGCADSTFDTLFVHPKPQAAFDSTNACLQLPNSFTNQSTISVGSITLNQWYFGDGDSSQQTSPDHVYADTGSYAVSLYVTSDSGCRDSAFRNVEVYPKPQAGFLAEHTCFGQSNAFVDTSQVAQGNLTSRSWNFGNGDTSSQSPFSLTYSNADTFDVRLIVETDRGCLDTADQEVVVHPAISNNTIGSEDTLCAGSTLDTLFGSVPSGGIGSYTYQWQRTSDTSNWVDVSGQTALHYPAHTIDSSTWFRRVVISGPCDSIQRSVSNWIYIHVTPGLSNNTITADQVICFGEAPDTLQGSTPIGGTGNFTYTWEVSNNDTNYSAISGSNAQDLKPGVLTDSAWYRRVVRSQTCDITSNRVKIAVKPLPEVFISSTNICFPESSFFQDTSFIDQGSITDRVWYFGDGDSSTQINPTHTYALAGNYNLRLIATSNFGCVDSANRNYSVFPKPQADFEQQNVCFPFSMNFTDSSSVSSGSVNFWRWDFGDGDTAMSQNPSHAYNADTSYVVRLIAGTGNQCLDTVQKQVRVFPKPTPFFGNTEVCFPLQTSFYDSSSIRTGNIVNWRWTFGDGDSSSNQNPQHTYTADGSYLAELFVTSDSGCVDSVAKLIEVHPLPVPDFALDTLGCLNADNVLINQTTGGQDYDWDFGNGSNSTLDTGVAVYSAIGSYTIKLIATTAFACEDSISKDIRIIAPPVAQMGLSLDSGCGPLTVSISNSSTNEFPTWDWDLGQNNIYSDTFPPDQTFPASIFSDTVYYVRLIASNKCGIDSAIDSVRVLPNPTAVLGTQVDQGCSPLHLSLLNGSYGRPNAFQWNYGDGGVSNNGDTSHTHVFVTGSLDSTFYIRLIASNQCSSDTAYDSVLVKPRNVISFFNTDTTVGCAPLTVQLSDFSVGANYRYYDLGDGNSSFLSNPQHTFSNPGTYTITQYADNGCSYDTSDIQVTVLPNLTASFTSNTSPECIGQDIQFTNQTSGVGGVLWRFGDGDSSVLNAPNHRYAQAGFYPVQLIVRSAANGCPAYAYDTVEVKALPGAEFTFPIDNGCPPFTLQANNTTPNGQFYTWHYGNGNTSSGNNPNFTYTDPGTYQVKLIASNLDGCVDSFSAPLVIHPVPAVDFDFNLDTECDTPATATFTNLSQGAVNYQWTFGDGNASTLNNPQHAYHSFGTFTIRLDADNQFGCSANTSKDLTVIPVPKASFTLTPKSGCRPLEVTFTNTSQNAGTYEWSFGDDYGSADTSPVHVYDTVGFFDVKLIARGGGSCVDSITLTDAVEVYQKPIASFRYTEDLTSPVPQGIVQFINQSKDADMYFWTFGDGQESALENPNHQYAFTGSYIVTLYAENVQGCLDTSRREITLTFFKGLFVPNAFTPNYGEPEVRVFKPSGKSLKTYTLQIFDTYGNLLWESSELDNGQPAEGWNGRGENGELLAQDVYVWKIRAEFLDGTTWPGMPAGEGRFKREGTVTLIR